MNMPGRAPNLSKADELNNIGSQLLAKGQFDPARVHFLAALALEGDHAAALSNLGATLRNSSFYAASEVVAKRSVALQPDNAWFRSNLGVAKLGLKKYDEALVELKRALDSLQDSGPSWHNYGLVLYMTGRFEEALHCFTTAMELGASLQCSSDRALSLLALGRIQEGLAAYEVRWKLLQQHKVWKLGIPEWQGETLDGRRLLIHHEQGFGDSLMLVRFVKMLTKCQVTLLVPEPLRVLFQRSFPFVKVITAEDPSLVEGKSYDFHTPMLSLMRWLDIKKPSDISQEPYLVAKPVPAMRLPNAPIKIGICWASGDHSPALVDRRRLIPIKLFLPLLEDPDIALISLQKGDDVMDLVANGLEGLIFDISAKLDDFAATANTIASLDLVISVDSAVAHLAGALGKPCLLLSPYSRCWRWWSQSVGWPWYSRMRIFHQAADGSWDDAMRQVVKTAKWVTQKDI